MDTTPAAPLSHVEWRTPDIEACTTFLEQLFGWHFRQHGTRYREYCSGGVCVGLMAAGEPPAAGSCLAYLYVTDLEDVMARSRQLGGTTELAPQVIAGYGRYARIRAPEGSVFGLFQRQS